MISRMSLREKVGQLFVIRPDALEELACEAGLPGKNAEGTAQVTDSMRALYKRYPCGGFCLFGQNIVSPGQLTAFTEALHKIGPVRTLLAIDEEGGNVARLGNHPAFHVPKFPPMERIARTSDPQRAYDAGSRIGRYLREYGLDVDFAPVADVNTNPLNPVIGSRAFGADPVLAGQMAAAFLRGLQSQGVMGCLKHFPGHGDTSEDTHTGYAETLKTWDQLLRCEMIPFKAGICAGADLVMTAHIAAPHVTGNDVPSTMSRLILTDKLRGELGFDGVIVTDALEMGAITEKYTSAQASVLCLKAGADLLLMPLHYAEAFEGVVRAVETGEISEERLGQSVQRVLRLKDRLCRAPSET